VEAPVEIERVSGDGIDFVCGVRAMTKPTPRTPAGTEQDNENVTAAARPLAPNAYEPRTKIVGQRLVDSEAELDRHVHDRTLGDRAFLIGAVLHASTVPARSAGPCPKRTTQTARNTRNFAPKV
jgi:hypothetical protein